MSVGLERVGGGAFAGVADDEVADLPVQVGGGFGGKLCGQA